MTQINEEQIKSILNEIANNHSYDSWYGMVNDISEQVLIDYTIEAITVVIDHLRDAEVERLRKENEELKGVATNLHYENNRLKKSIHPNPFEHPISESKLKELVWKLDKEIWAKVEVKEATQSWGREQTSILIREYFGESDNEIKSLQDTIDGQRIKLSDMTNELAALKKQVEEMKNVITAHLESMNKWASIDARGMTQCTETLLKLKEALQK